jgi:hypothetical protein
MDVHENSKKVQVGGRDKRSWIAQEDAEEDENSNLLKYSSTLVFDPAPLPLAAPPVFFGEAGPTAPGSETSKRKT